MMHQYANKIYCSLKLIIFLISYSLICLNIQAQVKPGAVKNIEPPIEPRPRNYKLIDEHKDKDGNVIRTIQYDQGGKHIRETQITKNILNVRVPINPDTMNMDSVLVVVNKSNYVVRS